MSVLTSLLGPAVLELVIATLILLLFGRRAIVGQAMRLAGSTGAGLFSVAVAVALGGDLIPAVVSALAIAAVAMAMPRRWYAIGPVAFAALVVSFALYVAYLVEATFLLGGTWSSIALGTLLLGLEIGALGLLLASAFEMVDALCGPRDEPALPSPPERWPVVCLQVPAYNEPPDLVIATVRSLVAIDYPALRIQVIDNNTRDPDLWRPVETACRELREAGHRVEFVHLPDWPGFKAGALNWGMAHLAEDVEIVGIVDADYLVGQDWLRSTIPHFTDPQVAFVQTPQDYRAWEDSAFYRACYVGFAYFFAVGMVSRAHRNSIIFAGTMGLTRRSALEAIGGWDERIITEDAEASLRILASGARAVYVPRPFGQGIMPLSYEGLRKQRFRWAFGGIQVLRRHWRLIVPWNRRSGLTLAQRYDHLVGGLWWFNDGLTLGFTLFVGAASIGAILGRPFVVQRLSGIGLVLPVAFILLNLVRYLWALRATTGASPALALAALRVNLSLSWVIALACVRGLTQERGVFLPTPKFRGAAAIRELRVVWAESLVGGMALLLLIVVLLRAGFAPVGLTLAGLLGWSVLIYGSATGFALGDPTRAPLADMLRDKANLELAPAMDRIVRSRSARAAALLVGTLAVLVTVALVSESGRAPVPQLPFPDVPVGPIRGAFGPFTAPTESPSETRSTAPRATAAPAGTGPGSAGPASPPPASPSPSGTLLPSPTPSPTPSPSVTVTPRPTPPVPLATPSSRPTPAASLPSHPTPSPHVP